MLFFLSFVHHSKPKLSIDRTEWDFRKTQINILCVIVSIGKMGVPLYFEMLDNKSGNSNYKDRIKLFTKVIEAIGKQRIEILLMDREFIGINWLGWLKSSGIPFCVRAPKHHKITLRDGSRRTTEELLKGKKPCRKRNVFVNGTRLNLCLSYDVKEELLYLIGTLEPHYLKAFYRKRWTIELVFEEQRVLS
jgi:hypothetical protein